MKVTRFMSTMLLTACICGAAGADDGAINNKSMSHNIETTGSLAPTFEQDTLNTTVFEAEHAFTKMMGFYVPAQHASGRLGDSPPDDPNDPDDQNDPDNTDALINYYNIDEVSVEDLAVAKPLINVFLYGPAIGVDGTAFAHSFLDVYAAVSLDDGTSFKRTNLSQSAQLSSFNLTDDHLPAGKDPLPNDHTILFGSKNNGAMHAPGYDYPYTNHCVECHGKALQGSTQAPSCYSCHDHKWEEATPESLGPVVTSAIWKNGKLQGSGENAASLSVVSIINGETGDEIMKTDATLKGDFYFNSNPVDGVNTNKPPCTVSAVANDIEGVALRVLDKDGEPVTDCVGHLPILDVDGDLTNGVDYPGGAYNVFHAVAGNKVLVAWPSRFCEQGKPGYSFAYDADPAEDTQDELVIKRGVIADYLGIDVTKDLYLSDLFGVAGQQGSIDFADEAYPQAGVVPFGCVWTARGVLLPGDDPRTGDGTGSETDVVESSHMVWTKAERLTSGRRDPNRIEVHGVEGAGFVITWQEDPDGIRPGQGLGPGEGWSGAVAHAKTDVWYSFINWEHFDVVDDRATEDVHDPINIADHIIDPEDANGSGRPQVFIPMAMPMRLTNNDRCNSDYNLDPYAADDPKYFSYCNGVVAANYGLQNFCADTVDIPQGSNDNIAPICVNADDLPNVANTGSTRPRTSLQAYSYDRDTGQVDQDGNPTYETVTSAWVIVAAEESKGLGRYTFLPNGSVCTDLPASDDNHDPDCDSDIGKNQWYFSFDMGEPQTSLTMTHENGLVQNLVSQGNMLNQPEVDWRTGEFYPVINTADMWDFDAYNYDLYNTEIARRSSLLVQSISKAKASTSGLLAIPSWKQGAMRQGGPADTMLRRFVLPDGYADGLDNNPYAFENMKCEAIGGSGTWILKDGSNPYYPKGICLAPATNLSGVVPDTCQDDSLQAAEPCPTVTFGDSTFGIGDTNPILQGYIQGEGNTTRVLTWHQCPSDGEALDTSEMEGAFYDCDSDARDDVFVNLKDQSWYNPLDVSKGHRGFLDGDFVMFLYGWSPNWRLNAKGNDRYDLYVRRSFDGGSTWKTTPNEGIASDGVTAFAGDGTVTCETYRSTVTQTAEAPEPHVCYTFDAGDNEHARNVTQHQRMQTTTLDPRYAATRATIAEGCTDGLFDSSSTLPTKTVTDGFDPAIFTCDDLSVDYDSDLRNPSRYFMVFETGDNSTVEVGEAEPLDLYYSRAENFGDDYVVWTETDTGFDSDPTSVCYPTVAYEDDKVIGTVIEGSGFCNEFDRMNTRGDTHSSEASLAANPDGSKMYGVWAQWIFDTDEYEEQTHEIAESDAQARRVWWIDLYRSDGVDEDGNPLSYTIKGTQQSGDGDSDPQQ